MFCKNCGKELNETANFCTYCGDKITKTEEIIDTKNGFTKEDIECLNSNELDNLLKNTPNEEKQPVQKEKGNEEILSILFGFASLICAPFISVFSIPMSLSGIIFGGYSKNKYNKKFSVGKILNYVSFAVAIVTFVLSCLFVTNTAKLINDSNVIPNFQIKYNTGHQNEINEREQAKTTEYDEDFLETVTPKIEKEKIKQSPTQTFNMEKVSYSIPTNWLLHSLNSTIVNNNIKTVHEFSSNTDYIIIREFSVSDFYKEDLIEYINQTLNGINTENTFTKNNLLWNNITTNAFVINGEIYTANILYTNINDVVFMIESQSNVNSQETINSAIETIINSIN